MKLASVENMSKVPPLLVSFDLETTGRFPRYDEPISLLVWLCSVTVENLRESTSTF